MRKGRPLNDPKIEIYFGRRLKELRILNGMSQEKLGKLLDLTFQQVQKYESGKNRLSGYRIYRISKTLGVAPLYFFEGIDQEGFPENSIGTPEVRRLMKSFLKLDPNLRKKVIDLVAVLVGVP